MQSKRGKFRYLWYKIIWLIRESLSLFAGRKRLMEKIKSIWKPIRKRTKKIQAKTSLL